MLEKLFKAVVVLVATTGFAFAQVDVNKADQAALDGLKGIGPKTSKAILDERKAGGEFKDWADLERRVKGVGEKSSGRLSDAGLTVHGQTKPKATVAGAENGKGKPAAAKPADPKEMKPAAKKEETKK
jgi:competence protein ComEA